LSGGLILMTAAIQLKFRHQSVTERVVD